MEHDCKECVYYNLPQKGLFSGECSTCTNGDTEDTNNNFIPKVKKEIVFYEEDLIP